MVIIGPPAAGKSRIGKRLARKLNLPFVDTDATIVREHGPISEIFTTHGESHFRSLERAAVIHALATDCVVALGGGAVLDRDTQHDLRGVSVVLLTVQASAVAARIGNGKRPLITDLESWQALADSRAELYSSLAGFTIDSSHRPVDAIVQDIANWAKENS